MELKSGDHALYHRETPSDGQPGLEVIEPASVSDDSNCKRVNV